jgi:hypothetical protein
MQSLKRVCSSQTLLMFLRRSKDSIKIRRAQVILSSAQGFKLLGIAERFYFPVQHVRSIIGQFNKEGLAALEPKCGIGRPEKFSEEQKSIIIETAICPPALLHAENLILTIKTKREPD